MSQDSLLGRLSEDTLDLILIREKDELVPGTPNATESKGGLRAIIRDAPHKTHGDRVSGRGHTNNIPQCSSLFGPDGDVVCLPSTDGDGGADVGKPSNASDSIPSPTATSNGKIAPKHYASDESEGYCYQGWRYEEDSHCDCLKMGHS